MKKALLFAVPITLFSLGFYVVFLNAGSRVTGAPPYLESDLEPPIGIVDPLENWKRPDGPPRVGLQIGHLNSGEVPEELERLRNNTGASAAGISETEVNSAIAQETKKLLEERGIVVDILPATIPPDYWADVFVAIHADGSLDTTKSGFKLASPRRDRSGKSSAVLSAIEAEYQAATGLSIDPNVTRNMRGYYAFAWWRYDHSIHPMTTAVILETGFLTHASDREIIVESPELPAQGLSRGIENFLETEGLI